ncbi:PQQ-binding-like beta-propeller repeat protein [Haloferax sp. DFSO52]|uniref:outer membrane protein assembly factor BamB family protein n=1 Tax=Haloferax sp. DFSO52 TaxID=3388505 RepID=UPI003A8859AD
MFRKPSRRTFLTTLGALTATGVAGVSLADSDSTAEDGSIDSIDWPRTGWAQFRAGPGRAGKVASESSPDEEYVTEAWRSESGGAVSVDEPIVTDEAVFRPYIVDDKTFRGGVVAFEGDTGEERWRYLAPEYGADEPGIGRVTHAPATAEGALYLTSEAGYTDSNVKYGGLHALDVETGEIEWQKTPNDYDNPSDAWVGTPLITNASLYVQHLTNVGADPDQQEMVIEEIDPISGEVKWRSDASYRVYPNVAVDQTIYGTATYTDAKNELVAWNANDGSRRWTVVLEDGVNFIDSAAGTGSIYRSSGNQFRTGSRNRVVAHSIDDGGVQWETVLTPEGEESERFISAPAVADGRIYVTTALRADSSEQGVLSTVYALDADSGEVVWSHDTSTELRGDPSVDDDTVYVGGGALPKYTGETESGGRSPTVHALTAADGSEQWSYLLREDSTDTKRASTPTLSNGFVYVGRLDEGSDQSDGVAALEGSDVAPDAKNLPRSSDAPVARIVTDPEDAERKDLDSGTTVVLDGTASTSDVETYEWQFGEGAPFDTTGATTEVTLNFCGTLDVTLRVTGPDGRQSTDTVSLSTDG